MSHAQLPMPAANQLGRNYRGYKKDSESANRIHFLLPINWIRKFLIFSAVLNHKINIRKRISRPRDRPEGGTSSCVVVNS